MIITEEIKDCEANLVPSIRLHEGHRPLVETGISIHMGRLVSRRISVIKLKNLSRRIPDASQ
ncbi:hypothetical protein [Rhizobium sp.]|uniref:hypothetical protein n=1 Tax=Rhizobium sp. TaxID=391 RepID=UPI002EF77EB6